MEYIIYKLYNEQIEINSILEGIKDITHIYARYKNILFLFIAPHIDNEYKYIMRVSTQKTLDKWGSCEMEKAYDTYNELIKDFDLVEIIRELLDYYIYDYLEK